MGRFLLGVIVTLLVLVGTGLVVIYSGTYSIAATEPHSGLVRWAFGATKHNSVIEQSAGISAPPLDSPERVARGREEYGHMCVGCHGGPDRPRGPAGKGLNPAPPEIPHAVEEYTPAQLFWIVKHGIRMTGMPAWGETHDDEELWDVVAYIIHGWSPPANAERGNDKRDDGEAVHDG
ncbi:MAG: cytochrome c [Alphaproteobacteria bacterium]